MELSVFRQRSIEAMKQKARRGELFLTVAVGYVKAGGDRIEKDADRRVQAAIALVFRKFARASDDPPGSGVVPAGEGSACPLWARAGPPTGSSGACPSIRPSITC